jgi:hypothetical protein
LDEGVFFIVKAGPLQALHKCFVPSMNIAHYESAHAPLF